LAITEQQWYHGRFFVGARVGAGFVPQFFTQDTMRNFHAAVSFTAQITEWFGIQPEIILTRFENTGAHESGSTETRLLIPLLARATFRHESFSYGALGGFYLAIPGVIRDGGNNWEPNSLVIAGTMWGVNFGYRIGPGVLLFDLRGHIDFGYTEYVLRQSNFWFEQARGGMNFSIGYEIGIFGRR